ncbi:MAG: hypothetical protein HYS81_01510 [Candidatus Aenigmatarchaeota archaeon]|nr:MAG: hypothetical protein HYS81_01510 [Candidatus Aenigmarchaeota archaeon]
MEAYVAKMGECPRPMEDLLRDYDPGLRFEEMPERPYVKRQLGWLSIIARCMCD